MLQVTVKDRLSLYATPVGCEHCIIELVCDGNGEPFLDRQKWLDR